MNDTPENRKIHRYGYLQGFNRGYELGQRDAAAKHRQSHYESYKDGFNSATQMATRAVEITCALYADSSAAIGGLKCFMALLFSGHHFHLPTRFKDCGVAISNGLMRLVGHDGVYFMFDANAVNDWDIVENN